MKTVQVTRFGDLDVLQTRDAPDPWPGAGEVLIAVEVVEVLFLDTQLRAGWGQDFFPMRPPWVPGTGVAGTIRAVGDGVERQRVGTQVIARTGNEGAYAELVVVQSDEATGIPHGLDSAVATAALHDAALALDRLERAELDAGSRVLVTAAAGSRGQWLVPLAKETGAHVVGAAGGAAKTDAVHALGADLAVDYREPGWADAAGGPFNVVFDGAGGQIGRIALRLTADRGTFFGHGAASGDFAPIESERAITTIGVDVQLDEATWRRHTRSGLELLAAGRVTPIIGQRVPLAKAADAHEAMARRTVIGKSVLIV